MNTQVQPNTTTPSKWISSITLRPIEFGTNAGVLSFHLSFTGITPTDHPTAIAEVLYKLLHSGFPIRLVTLEGEFPDSTIMMTLVMALRRENFFIHAMLDGGTYYYWLGTDPGKQGRLVNWTTVELWNVVWSGFNCDEVLYHLTNETDPEPVLPSNTSNFYLIPPSLLPVEKVVKFLKNAKARWHLNVENPLLGKYIVKVG